MAIFRDTLSQWRKSSCLNTEGGSQPRSKTSYEAGEEGSGFQNCSPLVHIKKADEKGSVKNIHFDGCAPGR